MNYIRIHILLNAGCPNIEDLRVCKFLDGSTQCISSSLVCNGEIDCENGEDESVDICGQIVNSKQLAVARIVVLPYNYTIARILYSRDTWLFPVLIWF